MTRDEAISVFCNCYTTASEEGARHLRMDGDRFIDICVGLGMLKLDEPSMEAKFRDAFYELYPDKFALRAVHEALDKAGLAIVAKDKFSNAFNYGGCPK
jgi:hypothetical protein